jgi:vancomycin resistance protein YoaR
MRAEAGVRTARRGRPARKRGRARTVRQAKLALWLAAGVFALILVAGVVFAGSPARIPAGVSIAGVDVGGLTASEARAKLAEIAKRYESVPVVFTGANRRFAIQPSRVEIRADWAAAATAALEEGDGPIPLRGLQRLKLRLFGVDVAPAAEAYEPALELELRRMAAAVHEPAREAAIQLEGLQPRIVDAKTGSRLDRAAATRVVLAALAGFEREAVSLPVEVDEPAVTRETLVPVAARVRTTLSAPVRLTYRNGGWTIRPQELAPLLDLPNGGISELRIGGPAAERYFANLARGVRRKAVSADFEVDESGKVHVVRSRRGRELDVARTEAGILAAAARTQVRAVPLAVAWVASPLTTSEAKGLGIERRLASYSTLYAGSADRIQNLQRAVGLLDGARIGPGATFSFNERVGPRTEERGFRSAPVIMNGKYEEGIGGGVSQVATTLFNAAWEAGLPITDRTAHALYISRYPAGRDATVNYPDVDLQFRNDTGRWIVLDASYDESGIAISMLGGGEVRRVESVSGALEETGKPPVEQTPDPALYVGERVVEFEGEPAREIRVTRTVYERGEVLYEETWYTAYRAEPREVRVGTKPRPVEPPPPPPKEEEKKGSPRPPGPG